mmetsp:Transcript_61474/g.105782  ORF Transcript_61474/g.105782 Transcript_61474/m.105782 type:complete len:89 (-) Transcript_61474:115-381(-)
MSPLQHETQIYQSPEKSLSLNLIHGGLVCGPLAAGLRLSEKEVERAKGEMFAELRYHTGAEATLAWRRHLRTATATSAGFSRTPPGKA